MLAAASAGSEEILGVLDGVPVLVVGLEPGDDVAVAVPVWVPAVVVAVADATPVAPAPIGVDVALCRGGQAAAPAGWVTVDDPAAELRRVTEQVERFCQPSVVLAQLLRLGPGLNAEEALLAESLAYSSLQAGPAFAGWLRDRGAAETKGRVEPGEAAVVERRDARLMVTLNRPHVRNAVDNRLRDALARALTVAAADPSVTDVELRGNGPAFSSGGDLEEFGTLPDPVTAHLVRTSRSPARLLLTMGKRVTAHLHGACVGAGIELAAFAGTVLAAPDTRCQLPEVQLGLIPGSGGTVSIPRRIGRHRAAWMGISAAVVDVETALFWGLVDAIETAS